MQNKKILVPVDDSPITAQTLKGLIALKENITFPLTLLHVLDLDMLSYRGFTEIAFSEFEERVRKDAQTFMAKQKELLVAAGIEVETVVQEGYARETICALADSGKYDLLVIGRKAAGDLRNLLFGQVANYVIHHVKCPVLIV